MKATEPGPTVGIALESFDGSTPGEGKVLTFVSRDDGVTSEVVRDLQQRLEALESSSGAAIQPASSESGVSGTQLLFALAGLAAVAVLISAVTILAVSRITKSGMRQS